MEQQALPFAELVEVEKIRQSERILRKLNRIRDELNHLYHVNPDERPRIIMPEDLAKLLVPLMGSLEQEELWIIPLDTRNRVIKMHVLYKGTLNATNVRIAEIFRVSILNNAASLILAHNHPSGDPNPSPDDITLTRHAMEAGRLLDMEVLDHLVIGDGRWVSLRERGVSV